jgi:hypothetical protein
LHQFQIDDIKTNHVFLLIQQPYQPYPYLGNEIEMNVTGVCVCLRVRHKYAVKGTKRNEIKRESGQKHKKQKYII